MGFDTFSAEASLVEKRHFRRPRGVGYCMNVECEGYLRLSLLMYKENIFFCSKCKEKGFSHLDYFETSNNLEVYREVRVNYTFDPIQNRYKTLAIVRDERLPEHLNVFTLYTAQVSTEKRALKIAEQLLSNLLLVNDPADVIFYCEDTIYIDDPAFKQKLDKLSSNWKLISDKIERASK